MPNPLVAQLTDALDETARLVDGIRPDEWTAPTPCTEWSVRDVVQHLTAGTAQLARALGGPTAVPHADEPAAAFRACVEALVDALDPPESMAQTVTVSVGSVPAVVAVQMRLVETLVHGWDVAQGTRQQTQFAPESVQLAYEFSVRFMDQVPPGRSPFCPPIPTAPDVAPLGRLVSLLGRQSSRPT